MLALAVAVLVTDPRVGRTAHAPPLTTTAGAVAADDPTASAVGAAVLADGGSAADAAIATVLALGVVNPTSSGIGGGGFAIVYDAATATTRAYDFRETAPAALDPSDFVRGGVLDPELSQSGGLAVGVPGEIAGLATLSRAHGRLSWRRVVTPAARLARDGVPTSWFLAQAARRVVPELGTAPADAPLRALLTTDGTQPRRWGDPLVRPALARTLAAIARDPDALTRGPLAEDLVATTTAAGGVMTLADLADYRVTERAPLVGEWRGFTLATMPIPSSGGAVLLEMLGILDRTAVDLPKLGLGSSAVFHYLIEVGKHGFADRARALGDTDAGRAAAAAMLDPATLARLAKSIRADRVAPIESYGGLVKTAPVATVKSGPGGTSHVCVIDRDGNAVSLTTTVNGYFGAGLITAGGVVLNNQIDDFVLAAGAPNMYGLRHSAENLVGPGKRPLSSMTPVLVLRDGKVVGCVGGSGGPRIISNVFQVLVDIFWFGLDPRAAVESPRLHHQWSPDAVSADADITADVRAGLTARGHKVVTGPSITAVQAIRVNADGALEAASDPRKNAAPAAPAQ